MTSAPTAFTGHAQGAEYGQVMADILELVPDLWFPQSVWAYSKMQHDPQLRGVLAAYTLPIRKADWRVDPAGCRPEVAQVVADDLGLPLIGEDPKPAAARRRGVVWAEHLRLTVQGHLVYGFYPFEPRYDVTSGQARLVELAERVPASVSNILLDKTGDMTGIMQDFSSKPISRDRLVWYVNEKEGANWAGRSLLRPAYGPWLLKHEMWRVHGTSIRRFGMGVPNVEAPPGATVVQIAEAQRLASSMRVGETAGAGLPSGFKLNLTGLTGSVPDALAFIRYLDQQMATMALAGLLDLGSTDNGSRALGDVFMDLLHDAVQSIGDQVAAIATTDIAVRIVDYNWGDDEPAPRIVCGDVGAEREITVEALKQLLDAGALSADPELESYLRNKYGLPERSTDAPSVAPVPARLKPVAAGRTVKAVGLRRTPTPTEVAASTDFVKLQTEWTTALDALVKDWEPLTAAHVDDLVGQVEAAVKAGDAPALATMSVDTSDDTAKLAASMAAVAALAATEQREEAKRQGVTIPASDVTVDQSRLDAVAATITALLATGLASSAATKALVVWGPDSTVADVSTAVRAHLEGLTDATLRDRLGGALSNGQNAGRIAAVKAGPAPEVLAASEVLDANTCEACAEIDGHVYDSVAEAEADYAAGGFSGCLAGARCRGILTTVWDASSIAQAA